VALHEANRRFEMSEAERTTHPDGNRFRMVERPDS